MKFPLIKILCVFAALSLNLKAAEEAKEKSPLDGTWKWTFIMPDGGEITPQVKFKTQGEALTGTSRFRLGSETPLTNIKLAGDQVSFEVVRERDGERMITRYTGTLSGDIIKGKVTSKSSGTEQSYDWEAKRLSSLEGAWKWTVNFGPRPIEQKLTLKLDGEKLIGKITGAPGRGRPGAPPGAPGPDIEIHNGLFKDETVSFETERPGRDGQKTTNHYYGKFMGDKIVGKSEAGTGDTARTNDWTAIRAE